MVDDSDSGLDSDTELKNEKGVTPLFLVMVCAGRGMLRKGTTMPQCVQAIKVLVCLLKGVIYTHKDAYDVFDMVMNTHFSKKGIPYVYTKDLASNEQAHKACRALGIDYPLNLCNGFNNERCLMPCMDVFMIMCLLGIVPIKMLLALAALLDDAISLGSQVKKYEAPCRPLYGKRHKVDREEKALAYFAFLNHVRRGIKASMTRPQEEGEKENVCIILDDEDDAKEASSSVPTQVPRLATQTSHDFLDKGNEYEYQNVLNLGAAILYVN